MKKLLTILGIIAVLVLSDWYFYNAGAEATAQYVVENLPVLCLMVGLH